MERHRSFCFGSKPTPSSLAKKAKSPSLGVASAAGPTASSPPPSRLSSSAPDSNTSALRRRNSLVPSSDNRVLEAMVGSGWTLNEILPPSLLIDIFHFLGPNCFIQNLSSAALTCRHWRSLIWNRLLTLNLSGERESEAEDFVFLSDPHAIRLLALSPILHTLNLSNNNEITDDTLFAVSKLRCLKRLEIGGCLRFTEEGLSAYIGVLGNLEYLDVSNMGTVGDDLVRTLAPRLPGLSALLLANVEITNAGLTEIVEQVPGLTLLDISECRELSDEGISQLPKLRNLTSLNMSHVHRIKEVGWTAVGRLGAVRRLGLRSVLVTDQSVPLFTKAIVNLTNLEELSLGFNRLEAGAFGVFARLPGLRRLEMNASRASIPAHAFQNFAKLKYLEYSHGIIPPGALQWLVGTVEVLKLAHPSLAFPDNPNNLPPLSPSYADATDHNEQQQADQNEEDGQDGGGDGGEIFSMSPLEPSPIQSAVVRSKGRDREEKGSPEKDPKAKAHRHRHRSTFPPKAFQRLQNLSISYGDVSDRDLRYVTKNGASLQKLSLLHASKLTSTGFRRLASLSELRRVNLGGCPGLTDHDLTFLVPHWPSLQSLSLAQCKQITDVAVFAIAAFCKDLKVLNFHHLPISDKGISRLEQLEELSLLEVTGCVGVSREAIESLQKARPRLLVNAAHLAKPRQSLTSSSSSCSIS